MAAVLDFEAMFQKYWDANTKEWDHDRTQSVGASEVFGCLRKALLSKREKEFKSYADPPSIDDNWGAMERGNIIEDHYVVPVIRKFVQGKAELLFANQAEQVTMHVGRASATPDGLIAPLKKKALKKYGIDDIEGDSVVVEVKSFDPRAHIEAAKAVHIGQAMMQMGMFRETTKFKPMYAVILYVNASFLDDIRPFVVKFDENAYENGKRRAEKVFTVEKVSEIEPEGKIKGLCEFCDRTHACAKFLGDDMPTGDALEDDDMDEFYQAKFGALAERHIAVNEMRKNAEVAYKEISAEIKAALQESNTKKVSTSKWSMAYSFVKGRESLDKDAMKEAGIDLTPFTKTGNGFEKLLVKKKISD